ncbi:chaplin family protein, partial [Microbacterium sp.]|uniref:chaplin family protein n=1 Tax=Microbacterium sp. TaxID=51671 RepID=UPI0028AA6E33
MRTIVKHAMWGVLIAGGVSLLGATAASAAETNGDEGLLSGTQILAPVTAPIDIVGNAVSVLGSAAAGTSTDAAPAAPSSSSAATTGEGGVASGTQALVDVVVPVTVSGNAVSVLGSSAAESDAAAPAPEPAPAAAATSGSDGILAGTQGLVSVTAPITVTGNSISVLGDSAVTAGEGEASAPAEAPMTDAATSGDDGILGGTQVLAPITAPVTVTGNGISVLGESAVTQGPAGNSAPAEAPMTDATTSGDDGILGGTQVLAPIT